MYVCMYHVRSHIYCNIGWINRVRYTTDRIGTRVNILLGMVEVRLVNVNNPHKHTHYMLDSHVLSTFIDVYCPFCGHKISILKVQYIREESRK